jgi:hypothetical protein
MIRQVMSIWTWDGGGMHVAVDDPEIRGVGAIERQRRDGHQQQQSRGEQPDDHPAAATLRTGHPRRDHPLSSFQAQMAITPQVAGRKSIG